MFEALPNHQLGLGVLQLQKKDLGQLHLCRPAYGHSKRATMNFTPKFCKNSIASDHQFGICQPQKKDPCRSIAPQGAVLWPFKEGNFLRNFSKFGGNCSSVFKHLFLRPGVEFFKNSKTQNHQNEVLLPWNRHPGQLHLLKASYSLTELVTVTGFSPILFN